MSGMEWNEVAQFIRGEMEASVPLHE